VGQRFVCAQIGAPEGPVGGRGTSRVRIRAGTAGRGVRARTSSTGAPPPPASGSSDMFARGGRPTTPARVLERGSSDLFLHRTWSQKSTTGSSVDVPTRPSRQSRARGGFQWNRAMTKTAKSSGKKPSGAKCLILRSNVSRALPDEDVEVGVTEDASSKGTKRKRAPPTKGPCEHGVKYRSQCKVCCGCPHGKWRYQCKECGGSGICEHGRIRSTCKECGGSQICQHGRVRSQCKECGGSAICEHGRHRSVCKECGGGGICEHGRQRSLCKECGGSQICEHDRERRYCKECGGSGICEHGRQRSQCKECRGSSVPVGRWVL